MQKLPKFTIKAMNFFYTESGLKLSRQDLASLATQGVCTGAQVRGELPVRGGLPPNAYTGYGISVQDKGLLLLGACQC
jgi:hypothetical protein